MGGRVNAPSLPPRASPSRQSLLPSEAASASDKLVTSAALILMFAFLVLSSSPGAHREPTPVLPAEAPAIGQRRQRRRDDSRRRCARCLFSAGLRERRPERINRS